MRIVGWVSALSLLSLIMPPCPAHAWSSPLGVCLTPDIELPNQNSSVFGLRFGFVGDHKKVYGLDIQLFGGKTEETFVGSAISMIANQNRGTATIFPVQFAFGVNINEGRTRIFGIQFSTVNSNNGATTVIGSQLGMINHNSENSTIVGLRFAALWNGIGTELHNVPNMFALADTSRSPDGTTTYGIELGIIGNSSSAVYGLQVGMINVTNSIYGVQIGLINVTNSLHGLQIGLFNVNRGGPIRYLPILNAGF